jgi:hypothetical protein
MRLWLLIALLVLPLLAAPQLRPEQTMVLVVGPTSSPIDENEQAVVTRLNDVRKQAGLTQLLLATMHFDQPTQARICREKLGITESDLICLAVVQLDLKTRRPVKTLYKVSKVTPASLEQVEKTVRQWAAQSGVKVPAELGVAPRLTVVRNPAALQGVDMNGDGKTDIFTVKEGRWLVSYSATEPYALLSNQPPIKLERMGFGDFDGDGRTDVFVVPEDSYWRVSLGGIGPMAQLNELKEGPRSLRFADLDGDGRTDVFNANGSQWRYSSSGAQPWKVLQNSNLRAEEVALADFNGDGKADVFAVVNGVWKVSLGGTEPLTTWNPNQGNKFERLRFGDFNGDGKTDVFTELRHEWLLSDNGKTPLRKINQARGIGVADMGAGDFDGDKKADILVVKDNRWSLSSGGTAPLKAVNSDAGVSIRGLRF